MLDMMMECMFITYEELNMINMVVYLTVNMVFTVLHSIENPSLFTNNKRLLRYLTVVTVSRAYHNDMCLRSDRN